MVEVNIKDSNFIGDNSSCHKSDSKYIKWVRDNTPVGNSCFITDNHLKDIQKAKGVKRTIAWLLEPRAINPQMYNWIEQNNRLFNFVLTYDLDLVKKGENYLYYPHSMCWIDNANVNVIRNLNEYNNINTIKTKNCSIIASAKNDTIGHQLRHKIIGQQYPDVNVFGRGYKPVDNKSEALNEYRFSIVVENSIQRGYFTEKIIDCFATMTIPIYWGDTAVNDHFASDGILRFNTLKELDIILDDIKINGQQIYRKKSIYVNHNFSVFESYRIAEDWIYINYPFLFK